VEFPFSDLSLTKQFFTKVFGWIFEDYGTEYIAFSNEGLDEHLEETQSKVERGGGLIVKPIFSFPGGRRFHFTEPCGNEFAVWTDKNA
jgi:uncharacterized protein